MACDINNSGVSDSKFRIINANTILNQNFVKTPLKISSNSNTNSQISVSNDISKVAVLTNNSVGYIPNLLSSNDEPIENTSMIIFKAIKQGILKDDAISSSDDDSEPENQTIKKIIPLQTNLILSPNYYNNSSVSNSIDNKANDSSLIDIRK